MAGLREYWDESLPEALRDEVIRRYGGKRIAYRERYLTVVLTAFEALEQLCTDPIAVRLAAWFHRAERSTEASALLAEELLPKYDVSPVRTAEVARLVRLTGGPHVAESDANGNVLLDAVESVYADPRYATHASEVRRDAGYDVEGRRQLVEALLKDRIYRTQLAYDRYETAARANLTDELTTLDGLTPHPWRGWQRAALAVTAVLSAFVAFVAGVAAVRAPWRVPEYSGDSVWPAVVLMLAALVAVAVVYSAVVRNARVMAAAPAVVGVIGALVVWLTTPDTNGASGVGERVPFLMILSVLLIVAGAAAFAATRFTPTPGRNRGQRLAGLGAVVVVFLAIFLVIDPLQRAYLLSANEYLDGQHQPANLDVRTDFAGGPLWTSKSNVQSLVATAHGIAIARGRGTVEMLDPATGQSRWRYTRADTDDAPHLYALNGGQQVLASYEDLGYVALDADTGQRKAAWPQSTRDYDIDDNDPLITGKSVSKGSDKLYGTNLDGSNRWTYEPGRCTGIGASATPDTVVVQLGHSCGSDPDQLVGLNLKNGKKLWTHDGSLSDLTTVGGLVVGLQSERYGPLVGVDPRSGDIKWRAEIPSDWTCPLQMESAGNHVALVSCPGDAENRTDSVVEVVDAGTGKVESTTPVQVGFGQRYAVTTDGVVVLAGPYSGGTCRLATVSDGAVGYYNVDDSVLCGYGVRTAGNLVLVSGEDGLIALR
ncbi:PQQ-binding-like beta-propeller repeat protein [Kribbella sp. NBC_00709]|uniref:outer membrane protein assembly factor BamB family protein n=1 Tax=Kribbella sp. NBC_00709 TaxID=2975972 RepID=UPI002E2D9DEE|nr:PQQ-binding-like beta-propeller repeat protein [Kribbella sp. NBC_00709]